MHSNFGKMLYKYHDCYVCDIREDLTGKDCNLH